MLDSKILFIIEIRKQIKNLIYGIEVGYNNRGKCNEEN